MFKNKFGITIYGYFDRRELSGKYLVCQEEVCQFIDMQRIPLWFIGLVEKFPKTTIINEGLATQ